MPVEIKELVIRAIYEKTGKTKTNNNISNSTNESDKLEIIETCVEQVLDILEKRSKR